MRHADTGVQRAISRQRGQGIVDDFWGGYVAFLTPSRDELIVIRDPSAAMPCYFQIEDGRYSFASDVETLMAGSGRVTQVDWEALWSHLRTPGHYSAQTCLTGVQELPRGYALRIGPNGSETAQLWSPWRFTEPDQRIEEREAANRLHEAVRQAVLGWASVFDRITLSISGGLDSSIVAACLSGSAASVTGLTMVDDSPVGNETAYARAVADQFGFPLRECRYEIDAIDLRVSNRQHLPRPGGRAIGQAFDHAVSRVTDEVGAAALFTGGGGDNVFCFMQSAAPLADRLIAEGWGVGAWRTLNDVCWTANCTYRQAIDAAHQQVAKRGVAPAWRTDDRYLIRRTRPRVLRHPWLEDIGDTLPGRAAHVKMISTIHNFIEAGPGPAALTPVSPLLSQPVIEAALCAPTWLWCRQGRDRSLARRAFSAHLPAEIIDRVSKGGPDGISAEVFRSGRRVIEEMLMDGCLVQNGVADRAALAHYFRGPSRPADNDQLRLLDLADAEAWSRSWAEHRTSSLPAAYGRASCRSRHTRQRA